MTAHVKLATPDPRPRRRAATPPAKTRGDEILPPDLKAARDALRAGGLTVMPFLDEPLELS